MMMFMVLMLEWIAGLGTLGLIGYRGPRSMTYPMSLLLGIFIHNVMFFCCDLVGLGLGQETLLGSAVAAALLAHSIPKRTSAFYNTLVKRPQTTLRMHDVVVLVLGCALSYYIVWASWFWPVTPFDAMAGIDLVARQAVQEGTVNNRVFVDPSLAGQLSNQPFYAPFAMLLQVQYRLMQLMFGQVWVAIVAMLYFWFMWTALRQFVNPFIANVLWLLLILTPEILGYTYLLQTDLLNAVYFTIGVVLIALQLKDNSYATLGATALAFGAACWSRSETIALVWIGCIASIPFLMKVQGKRDAIVKVSVILLTSSVLFALWSILYVQMMLPAHPVLASEFSVSGVSRIFSVASDLYFNVISSVELWGLAFLLFTILFLVNEIVSLIKHNVTRNPLNAILLVWILATIVGLLLVGSMFTSAIVEQTLRRGIFKLIPLLMIYIAALPLMKRWGDALARWEVQI